MYISEQADIASLITVWHQTTQTLTKKVRKLKHSDAYGIQ